MIKLREKDEFTESGGGEMAFGAYRTDGIGDSASMESPIKMRIPRKSYTVTSNAAAEKKKTVPEPFLTVPWNSSCLARPAS
jgi:hypothetical protein